MSAMQCLFFFIWMIFFSPIVSLPICTPVKTQNVFKFKVSLEILTCWSSFSIFSPSSSWFSFDLFHPELHSTSPHLRCFTLTKRHTPPPRRARPNHSCSCHLPPFSVTPSPPSGPPSSVTPSGPSGPSSVAPPGPSVGRGPPVGVNSWK